MVRKNALSETAEQRLAILDNVLGLDEVKDLLDLLQEQALLGAVAVRPVLQESLDNLQNGNQPRMHTGVLS